jgi:hypothetical protein
MRTQIRLEEEEQEEEEEKFAKQTKMEQAALLRK